METHGLFLVNNSQVWGQATFVAISKQNFLKFVSNFAEM